MLNQFLEICHDRFLIHPPQFVTDLSLPFDVFRYGVIETNKGNEPLVYFEQSIRVTVRSYGPATQNAVCRSGLRSLSAAECYILSRFF